MWRICGFRFGGRGSCLFLAFIHGDWGRGKAYRGNAALKEGCLLMKGVTQILEVADVFVDGAEEGTLG